ncbi:MAG: serine/threonine protein kinase [Deltaproteobacteria bacterium]|nr:serine/threonine protein kinase [Deltaproteobacteria bacterium]
MTPPVNDGEYLLGELLGRGGMGQVHAARDREGRNLAVKRLRNTLSRDRAMLERFAEESRLLASVKHPAIVRVVDTGATLGGSPVLVMEHAAGTSLYQLIKREGRLPVPRSIAIAVQLLAGLAAIHDAQIIHADIKSNNILVDADDRVTIIDFGLARPAATPAPQIAGTPEYMAPEVIRGHAPQAPADLYAVATVVYEMMVGATPFGGGLPADIFERQLHDPIVPPALRAPDASIPRAVEDVVMKALSKDPAARYPSAQAFAEALVHASAEALMSRTTTGGGVESLWDEPTKQRPAPMLLGRQPADSDVVARRRDGLRAAVVSNDPEAIIQAYLALASSLLEDRRTTAAIAELEGAVHYLAPSGEEAPAPPAGLWRIETVLAALYDGMGKKERARRVALVAYQHALRSGCELAEARARNLVGRLVEKKRSVVTINEPKQTVPTRPRRIAQGSGPAINVTELARRNRNR